MSRARAGGEAGFTLVELLVVLVMAIVVFGATLGLLVPFTHADAANQRQNDAQDIARTVLDRLSQQLRNLASPTPSVPLAVDKAAAYDLVFQSVDPNGPNSGANLANVRRIRYCLGPPASTTGLAKLYSQVQTWTTSTVPAVPDTSSCPSASASWNGTTQTLSQNVVNQYGGASRPLFAYDSAVTTAITQVKAELWVDDDVRQLPAAVPLTTGVFLRNQNQAPSAQFLITLSVGAHVIMNGSPSSDPEGQPLSYVWYDGSTEIGACQGVVCDYTVSGSGRHDLSLRTFDPSGLQGTSSTYTVTVP